MQDSTIQPPDSHRLAAVEGWLGLGDWQEAEREWLQIDKELYYHPDVQQAHYLICAAAGRWDVAIEIAVTLTELTPDRPFGWFQTAFSLNKLNHTGEAYDLLKLVVKRFPKDVLMHYNMACFACKLGNLEEAWRWLVKTFELDAPKGLQSFALQDPDLRPLWEGIELNDFKLGKPVRIKVA